MQGDLISRSELIENLREYKTIYGCPMTRRDEQVIHFVIGHIKNLEPTAYSVEKVIEHTHKIFVDELEIIEKGIPEGGEYTEEAYRILYLNKKISDAIRDGGKE
jgi:hypothetical protein